MVRYNNWSILRRIDLDDFASVRRIIACLNSEFDSGSLTREKRVKFELNKMESAWVNDLLQSIARTRVAYPLLKEAIFRFVAADFGEDEDIIKAVKELESVAEEHILTIPESHLVAYEKALKRLFRNIKTDRSSATIELEKLLPIAQEVIRTKRTPAIVATDFESMTLKRKIRGDSLNSLLTGTTQQETQKPIPALSSKKRKLMPTETAPGFKRKGRPFGSKNVQAFTKKYTVEEDDKLYNLRQEGKMWKDITKLMGDRTMASCQQRYATIVNEREGRQG